MNDANSFNGKPVPTNGTAGDIKNHHTSTAACGIAIMAKASAPGRTKTRLVPPLTFEQAAALNTAFLQDITDNLIEAGKRCNIAGYVAYGPPDAEEFFSRSLPPTIGLIEAWLPTLGDCLVRTAEQLFARGHRAAVLLNSDSPTLPTALLIETAEVLAQPGERAVLGPSTDGGYYLLGLKSAHPHMFEDIAWSTGRVAAQTLERAREIKLDVHVLPAWYDIDDIEDLDRLNNEIRRGASSTSQVDARRVFHPPRTAALLQSLCLEDELTRRRADPFGA
jgi:uncharacterized protein